MTKWAEVTVRAVKTMAIEIHDDQTIEDAKKFAIEEVMDGGEAEVIEASLAKDEDEADTIRRHADEKYPL